MYGNGETVHALLNLAPVLGNQLATRPSIFIARKRVCPELVWTLYRQENL